MHHVNRQNTRAGAAPRAYAQDEGNKAKEVVMGAEVWAIISVGIVILVAMAASHRALRQEMNERFREVNGRIDGMNSEMNGRFGELSDRIASLRAEMIERFGELSERLSRVEGFLEGMGYATWKRANKEERSDGEH